MRCLVMDPNFTLRFTKPYVVKYDREQMVTNRIWIGNPESVEFTRSEQDALELLAKEPFHSLIIGTGKGADGCMLLEKIRKSDSLKNLPVTIM